MKYELEEPFLKKKERLRTRKKLVATDHKQLIQPKEQ
jgi:hypothetical protein